MSDFRLETERLILRDWREGDAEDFHRLGSDPEVMATLGPLMSFEESLALINRLQERAASDGHCMWAAERRSDGRVLGFIGVQRGRIEPIDGELEIGWRLARDCWGQGLATEGARATLDWLSRHRSGEHVVAITASINDRSRAVMERLGMTRDCARDFDHPSVAEGDPLRPHVTYVKEPPL
ncbi:GNAT family N-acetyltransferase [Altererythrobacter lutimaris]|uniref:GNAT family N-acetyltransferase n=1 Tax=Altererythrobacter lutimaris TaxID=2743979 RepID=UPI002FC3AD81